MLSAQSHPGRNTQSPLPFALNCCTILDYSPARVAPFPNTKCSLTRSYFGMWFLFGTTPHLLSGKAHFEAPVQKQLLLGSLPHHRASCPSETPQHFPWLIYPLGFFKLQARAIILKQCINRTQWTIDITSIQFGSWKFCFSDSDNIAEYILNMSCLLAKKFESQVHIRPSIRQDVSRGQLLRLFLFLSPAPSTKPDMCERAVNVISVKTLGK